MPNATTQVPVTIDELEEHRRALTGYCYRMLGSPFEADDAVQDTLVRAWRGRDRFEGRAAVRTWLYRIATNVCLDALRGRQRRARPVDLSDPWSPNVATLPAARPEGTWVEPIPDGRILPTGDDPGEMAVAKDTIRLAFVAALQLLPPRQRAVLILREVLRWKADEVAELLDTSVASVNSALQRARATMAASDVTATDPHPVVDDEQQALLARYVDAFERYDIDELVALLHEDATLTMPPIELWLKGRDDIGAWYRGHGSGCRGSQLSATSANGRPAFVQYRPEGPFALQVLETSGDQIVGIETFLAVDQYFPLFGFSLAGPTSD